MAKREKSSSPANKGWGGIAINSHYITGGRGPGKGEGMGGSHTNHQGQILPWQGSEGTGQSRAQHMPRVEAQCPRFCQGQLGFGPGPQGPSQGSSPCELVFRFSWQGEDQVGRSEQGSSSHPVLGTGGYQNPGGFLGMRPQW
jgi:hypothetical protein